MDKITIDVWWTKIIWALFRDNKIINSIKMEIWEYNLEKVTHKMQDIINKFITTDTIYIWISLNGQTNNNYVYFSRVLWGWINNELIKYLDIPNTIEFQVDNDVNCMCRWIKYLNNDLPGHFILLNIWTWLRTSYFYNWNVLKWAKWFFGEIRDNLDVLELWDTINANDLICGRGISNIYEKLNNKNISAEEVHNLSQMGDQMAVKAINIFEKYFVGLLCRVTYMYNPQSIIIDWSVKIIIKDHFDKILGNYKKECEEHFLAKLEISKHDDTALYWALFINNTLSS